MDRQSTTLAIQRYLDELNGANDLVPSEPLVRELLSRAAKRLQGVCKKLLRWHYPRLSYGPLNLTSEELLGGVVERLIKALRKIHPPTVRQFFALANKHMRWELNDFVRQLDAQACESEIGDTEFTISDPPSETNISLTARRIMDALEKLPEEEREAFDLMRIQGLSRAESAQILGVSEKTIQRRLKRASILLIEILKDLGPLAFGPNSND